MTTDELVKVYRIRELASLWGCSEASIYKLMRQGKLHGFHIGTALFFSAREVREFIVEREAEAVAAGS